MSTLAEFAEEQKKRNEERGLNSLFLKKGENRVRIATDEIAVYDVHFVDNKTIVCVGEENGCDVKSEKERVKRDSEGRPEKDSEGNSLKEKVVGHFPGRKAMLWVIDRNDAKIKILEVPMTVAEGIAKLKESEEYGYEEIPPYDIIIKKEGEGKDTRYSVIPSRKDTLLSNDEIKEIETKPKLSLLLEKRKESQTKRLSASKKLDEELN